MYHFLPTFVQLYFILLNYSNIHISVKFLIFFQTAYRKIHFLYHFDVSQHLLIPNLWNNLNTNQNGYKIKIYKKKQRIKLFVAVIFSPVKSSCKMRFQMTIHIHKVLAFTVLDSKMISTTSDSIMRVWHQVIVVLHDLICYE